MQLTYAQKLEAMALRFYQGLEWDVSPGDLYTTCRDDLEVYRVVDITAEGMVITEYTEGGTGKSQWPLDEFLTAGFGPKRVWVPDWILD